MYEIYFQFILFFFLLSRLVQKFYNNFNLHLSHHIKVSYQKLVIVEICLITIAFIISFYFQHIEKNETLNLILPDYIYFMLLTVNLLVIGIIYGTDILLHYLKKEESSQNFYFISVIGMIQKTLLLQVIATMLFMEYTLIKIDEIKSNLANINIIYTISLLMSFLNSTLIIILLKNFLLNKLNLISKIIWGLILTIYINFISMTVTSNNLLLVLNPIFILHSSFVLLLIVNFLNKFNLIKTKSSEFYKNNDTKIANIPIDHSIGILQSNSEIYNFKNDHRQVAAPFYAKSEYINPKVTYQTPIINLRQIKKEATLSRSKNELKVKIR